MSVPPLPTTHIAEILPRPVDDPWLVRSLWPASAVGLIGGPPKCAKTWLALDLALSVASNTPCLGTLTVESPGPVLLYLAEDSLQSARARVEGVCEHRRLDLRRVDLHLITVPSLRLDQDQDKQRLAATVEKVQPRLLLLDPFVRLHRSDENDSGAISAILADLRALQRRFDVAVVLVHHARKNGRGPQGYALRGPAISMLGATPTPISADATAPSGSPSSTAHTLPPIPSRSSSSRAPTAPPRTSRSLAITRRPPRRRLRPSRRASSPPLVRLSHVNNSARASRSRTSAWETPLKPFNAPAASPRPRRAGSPPASSRVPAFPSRKRHTRTGTERGTRRPSLTTPAILRGTNRVRGRATQQGGPRGRRRRSRRRRGTPPVA